jgi:tRNA dimethylallyltransferase
VPERTEGRTGASQRPTPLLALVGPTASGKTAAAVELATDLGAEIVSVDSMLVYRGMDVGTAKPGPEDLARVPHHLVDVAEPGESFSVARYQRLALRAVAAIRDRGRRPLLAGGSGLYCRAVVDELRFPGTDARARALLEVEAAAVGAMRLHDRLDAMDPRAAGKIDPANVRRTVRALEVAAVTGRPFSAYARDWERYPSGRVRAAGIELEPPTLRSRVDARLTAMLERGFVEEVRALLERGLGGWLTASRIIGYAEIAGHLDGVLSLDEAVAATARRTRSLARRQMAWFRRDPRVRWFTAGSGGAVDLIAELRRYLRG